MLAMDTGTAMVISAAIAAVPTVVALLLKRSINQINRAVNHVGKGEPTLIERVRRAEEENHKFRVWVCDALHALATQVGTVLPKPPHKEGQ